MEGFNTKVNGPENSAENSETRQEKIVDAEREVVNTFTTRLAEILDRIGENPYFQNLESRF